MYLGAGRECRYSGARRGIGKLGAPRGCCGAVRGYQGCNGGWQVV